MSNKSCLLIFSLSHLQDMQEKGNVWYLRHYEAYFARIYVVYLLGKHPAVVRSGKTVLVSLARSNKIINFFMAPLRLYKAVRRILPTVILTADLVFLWWTSCIIRLLGNCNVFLMPVCIPEEIYRSSKHTLSGLPQVVERIFINLSFNVAYKVITGSSIEVFVSWLSSIPNVKRKLIIARLIVEELPPLDFYDSLQCYTARNNCNNCNNATFNLIYVGRFHHEKMVIDLIYILQKLIYEYKMPVELTLIGDGQERKAMEVLAQDFRVRDKIKFLGTKKSAELVLYYKNSDIFFSTLTGTALREAALCGLPIIAYEMDWVKGLIQHKNNGFLVKPRDIEASAKAVYELWKDDELRRFISFNMQKDALRRWGLEILREALSETFEEKNLCTSTGEKNAK